MNSSLPRKKVVFVISKHETLGPLIEAYFVKPNSDGSLSMDYYKAGKQNIPENGEKPEPHILKIIELTDEYSERAIARKFGRKHKTAPDYFLKEFSKQVYETSVRPYIENRIARIFETLTEYKIPLHYKGTKKDYIRDEAIRINESPAIARFNFQRIAGAGIHYFLTLKAGEKNIGLYAKEPLYLCQKPAMIFLDNEIFLFEKDFDLKKLQPFYTREYIAVPENMTKKYLKTFVLKVAMHNEADFSGFDIERPEISPSAYLYPDINWQGKGIFSLQFHYGDAVFRASDKQLRHVRAFENPDSYKIVIIERNPEFEVKIRQLLEELGLIFQPDASFTYRDEDVDQFAVYHLIEWFYAHKKVLGENKIYLGSLSKEKRFNTEIPTIKITLKGLGDWFDIQAIAKFGNFEIPLIRLRRHILSGKREYRLPDGSIAILPAEWFEKYKDLLQFSSEQALNIKLPRVHAQTLHSILPELKPQVRKEIEKISEPFALASVDLPFHLNHTLRPYQKTGFSWLYQLSQRKFGACLSDDMGLGKTIQALALLQKNREEDEKKAKNKNKVQIDLFNYHILTATAHPSLIVMPVSLIYNWIREIERFTPGLRYLAHTGQKRTKSIDDFYHYHLILTSYGIVRNDLKILRNIDFKYLILDESQLIKNPESKAYRAAIQLKAQNRIILTGTPVENSLSDLWAQMNFINPGLLGDFTFFRNEFQLPIEKNQVEDVKNKLKKLIHPFILRRTKEEVARELPPLIENIRYCEMSEEQFKKYESTKACIRNLLWSDDDDVKGKKMLAVLRGLMKLRQIANHPKLADSGYDADSGKFEEVTRNLDNVVSEGHKVLVYSAFVQHLELFRKYLLEKEIRFSLLTGTTPAKQRTVEIDLFQKKPDVPVFLISLKAGGVGLNLTAADYVFILDPWWNPASEMQAISRAHRIGQDKSVISYKFISKGSVEEKILDLQERKRLLADDFINSNNPLKGLESEEIKALFE